MDIKSKILERLEAKRGEYISGEPLSRELGVTRQSVWKAVKSLTAEGYVIHSVTNKGYMLDGKCDRLSASVISSKTGAHTEYFDCISSTNVAAKQKFCERGACIIVADAQTQGRKKDGGNFISPEKKGIYMTVALPLDFPLDQADRLRAVCAKTVAACIGRACGTTPEIKDTDELYMNGKKVCGLLTEAEVALAAKRITCAIIGIGIYTADVGGALGHIDSSETRNALISDIYLNIKQRLNA